jgi:hypothetical protein
VSHAVSISRVFIAKVERVSRDVVWQAVSERGHPVPRDGGKPDLDVDRALVELHVSERSDTDSSSNVEQSSPAAARHVGLIRARPRASYSPVRSDLISKDKYNLFYSLRT